MDYLSRTYRSSMRLFADRPDILVPGQWYWSPPGAKAVPHPTAFGPSVYFFRSARFQRLDFPLGEVDSFKAFKRGEGNPRYLGQSVCGDAEAWRHGVPYAQRGTPPSDSEGVPFCCNALPPWPGGESEDGSATIAVNSPAGVQKGGMLATGGAGFVGGVLKGGVSAGSGAGTPAGVKKGAVGLAPGASGVGIGGVLKGGVAVGYGGGAVGGVRKGGISADSGAGSPAGVKKGAVSLPPPSNPAGVKKGGVSLPPPSSPAGVKKGGVLV